MPDELAAEETVANAQHRAAVDVKSMLEKRLVRVAVVDEARIADHHDLVGIVASENALLVRGEEAVLDDQLGRREGVLVADPGAVAAERIRDMCAPWKVNPFTVRLASARMMPFWLGKSIVAFSTTAWPAQHGSTSIVTGRVMVGKSFV